MHLKGRVRTAGLHDRCTFAVLRPHPQAFLPPQPLQPLPIHLPTLTAQQRMGEPIAEPRPVPRDLAQPPSQLLLRRQHRTCWPPLGASALPNRPTRPALRDSQSLADMANGVSSAGRAQYFPRATSFSISMSSAWSATIRLSLLLSSLSRRSSLASSAFMPPY